MDDQDTIKLINITLAPYIQQAYVLTAHDRKVGGNQFRHAMATMAILFDYRYFDSVVLKAGIIHDLLEDVPETQMRTIEQIDGDGPKVAKLVLEVTRQKGEEKMDYLNRVFREGSRKAKIVKIADRISNLTDLHQFIFNKQFIKRYINETELIHKYALGVDENMALELDELVKRRKRMLKEIPEGE